MNKIESAERIAFRAGWRVNAVGEETHSQDYLDACEEVDWQEYRKSKRRISMGLKITASISDANGKMITFGTGDFESIDNLEEEVFRKIIPVIEQTIQFRGEMTIQFHIVDEARKQINKKD